MDFTNNKFGKADAYSEPSQTSKVDLLAKIFNGWQPLIIFILDVWLGFECAFTSYNYFHNILKLFDVLTNFPFIISQTMRDYYFQTQPSAHSPRQNKTFPVVRYFTRTLKLISDILWPIVGYSELKKKKKAKHFK